MLFNHFFVKLFFADRGEKYGCIGASRRLIRVRKRLKLHTEQGTVCENCPGGVHIALYHSLCYSVLYESPAKSVLRAAAFIPSLSRCAGMVVTSNAFAWIHRLEQKQPGTFGP
jgi:hypothetical protein